MSEARSRGALDQQPIILEAHVPLSRERKPYLGHAQSAGEPSRSNRASPARPPVNPEKQSKGHSLDRRGRATPPSLGDAFPKTPEFGRHSTPYVFTPKASESSKTPSGDSGYFSSPEAAKVAAASEKRKVTSGLSDTATSDALRGKGKTRDANGRLRDGVSPAPAVQDFADDAAQAPAKRPPARYSFTTSDMSQKDHKISLRESPGNEPRPRLAELKAEALHEPRRNTDASPTSPRPRLDDALRRSAAASVAAGVLPSVVTSFKGTDVRSDRSAGSRPDSPISQTHSPRTSIHSSREDALMTGRSSSSGSGIGSKANSRPPSPKSFEQNDSFRRSSTFPTFPVFPTVPEDVDPFRARMSPAASASDLESQPPYMKTLASRKAPPPSSVPYPIDDITVMMPSEEEHLQRQHLDFDSPSTPSLQTHRKTNSKDSSVSTESPSRPRMSSRHTFDGDLPTISTASSVVSSPSTHDNSPTTTRSVVTQMPRLPPSCPRVQPSRQHDDWLTLLGCPEFDICPSCYDETFASGPFHKFFKRAAPKDPRQKTKCDFSSGWMRAAWLLTIEHHRYDLDLMYAVARITAREPPCPEEYGEAQSWYTVFDKRGATIENFSVCQSDVKKIEALMPSLRGIFTRQHSASGQRRKCELRPEGKRFNDYLDILIDIDEDTKSGRTKPKFERFQTFAKVRAQTRECMRDDMLEGADWHFIPQLPEFTVCEECYSTIVWPEITHGSSVASRFNRTPQLVHEARRGDRRRDSIENGGASCQLYSPRMRKIFKTAIRTGDLGYLARKAKERKDIELELQARFAKLQRLKDDHQRNGTKGSKSSAGLQAEFRKISEDWQRWQ